MEKFEKLSRNEMRNVIGGQPVPPACTVGALCTGYDDNTHLLISGTCTGDCSCSAPNGSARNDCSNQV